MVFLIILIIVALIIYCLLEYNNLTMINESTKEKFEDMDEKMRKRWDIMPKVLNVVRMNMRHERSLIEGISNIIDLSYNSLIVERKRDFDIELSEKIIELVEKVKEHPEFEANPKFMTLLSQLVEIQNEIGDSRIKYNEMAKEMNKKVKGFPSNLIAKIFGFKEQVIFE